METLVTTIKGIGIPYAYSHFAEGEAPDPPFLCYLLPGSDNFSADGKAYCKISEVRLELYTDRKDPDTERKVEYICIDRCFNYCGKISKCIYWNGLGVCLYNIQTAMDSMRIVKRAYDKDDGKQLHHVIISIYRDMYMRNEQELKNKISTERTCRGLIGMEICEYIYNLGFQNVYFLHDDSEHIHIHILVNSVSCMNGSKLMNLYSFRNNIEQYLKMNYPFLHWL